jgi:hypothetical protein
VEPGGELEVDDKCRERPGDEQPSDTAFADGTPGFSGRFIGTFENGGNTIVGRVQLSSTASTARRPKDHLPARVRSSRLFGAMPCAAPVGPVALGLSIRSSRPKSLPALQTREGCTLR